MELAHTVMEAVKSQVLQLIQQTGDSGELMAVSVPRMANSRIRKSQCFSSNQGRKKTMAQFNGSQAGINNSLKSGKAQPFYFI